MADHHKRGPEHDRRDARHLCGSGTCAYGWSKWDRARRQARVAAEAHDGRTLIETPCWAQAADTAADFDRLHVVNVMLTMQAAAIPNDAQTGELLERLCLSLRPARWRP
jgi:hypothetical protein